MPKCPFARQLQPQARSAGAFTSGPFKIVLHTTEGSTLKGALTALGSAHSESHFVVDANEIVQLIDTSLASKSLRNEKGGVETNRDSAIQIEMVGFAGKPKDRVMLANVRRLLRWIEKTHGVPRRWPNGRPKTHTPDGNDPGGHNRDADTWNKQGGYYGHSNVPENKHWDPGTTDEEIDYLMRDEAVLIPQT